MIQTPEAKEKKPKKKTAQKRKAKDENDWPQRQTKRVKKNPAKEKLQTTEEIMGISTVKEEPKIQVAKTTLKYALSTYKNPKWTYLQYWGSRPILKTDEWHQYLELPKTPRHRWWNIIEIDSHPIYFTHLWDHGKETWRKFVKKLS